MDLEKVILELRTLIPQFECLPGCIDCCGPTPRSKWEWDQVKDKRFMSRKRPLDCPYSYNGKCDVYEDRPILCRLYGTTVDLPCPHGKSPLLPLSHEQTQAIMGRYMDILDHEERR